ncbi:hypothetical protein BD779DRAFT_1480138 [Infundibulicybe gibba]|nr:hypothetical protein BD779DRAFT_1480138 [Infundibulicybe gibba]
MGTGTLHQLSASTRDMARQIASTGLYATVYDNINIMFSNNSQENGTCVTLFPLFKARLANLNIEDFKAAFHAAPPLEITDILHTSEERKQFKENLIFALIRIIVMFGGEGFKKFEAELAAHQPASSAKIELHSTSLHPLPAWNIDESTIIGNAEVDEAIVNELHIRDTTNFAKCVRFQAGDQLSLARLRALENIRAGQEDGYHGFFWGAWIPGLFHGKIADIHGLLMTHWGKPYAGTRNPGSLAFHNTRLDRLPITLTLISKLIV